MMGIAIPKAKEYHNNQGTATWYNPAESRQQFARLTHLPCNDSITNRDLSNRERDASIAPEDSRPGREIRRVRSLGVRQRATMGSQGLAHGASAKFVRLTLSIPWLETAIPRTLALSVCQSVSI